MIRDILDFFKREKFYAVLFLGIVTFYAAAFILPLRHSKPKPSPALEEFQRAEEKLETKVKNKGSLQNYLKSRPNLEKIFGVFLLFAFAAFTAGLALDYLFIFKPAWRHRIQRPVLTHGPPWTFAMLTKVILLFLAGSLIVGYGLAGAARVAGFEIPFNFYMLLHTTLADFLVFGVMVWVIGRSGGDWRDLGFRIPDGKFFREIRVGWSAYLTILPVFSIFLFSLVMIAHFFSYEPPPHPLVSIFLEEENRSPWIVGYSIFLATVFGPIFEEIFFRGFCYPIFKQKWGPWFAMILSAAFFALIHDNTFAFWPIFILGMGLAYLYEKRGSLIAPVVLHVTHNIIFIGYFFLAKTVVRGGG